MAHGLGGRERVVVEKRDPLERARGLGRREWAQLLHRGTDHRQHEDAAPPEGALLRSQESQADRNARDRAGHADAGVPKTRSARADERLGGLGANGHDHSRDGRQDLRLPDVYFLKPDDKRGGEQQVLKERQTLIGRHAQPNRIGEELAELRQHAADLDGDVERLERSGKQHERRDDEREERRH